MISAAARYLQEDTSFSGVQNSTKRIWDISLGDLNLYIVHRISTGFLTLRPNENMTARSATQVESYRQIRE